MIITGFLFIIGVVIALFVICVAAEILDMIIN